MSDEFWANLGVLIIATCVLGIGILLATYEPFVLGTFVVLILVAFICTKKGINLWQYFE